MSMLSENISRLRCDGPKPGASDAEPFGSTASGTSKTESDCTSSVPGAHSTAAALRCPVSAELVIKVDASCSPRKTGSQPAPGGRPRALKAASMSDCDLA